MNARHYILATAGHVDHGKSSLVKALTGVDPDRLPEEKARGITIDLGFAQLGLRTAGEEFHLGIVDVPGHEDFVKNMVAGVGSIDLALLIVAADDGWMPQTEEHLQILSYLGVTRAVVALTKIDLAQNEAQAMDAVRESLANSPFEKAPIVPTSVISGRGLDELKTELARILEKTRPPQNIGKPRLPVDRVFMLRGIGTVVTGTLTGGEFQRGQSVVIQPSGKVARIRSLQNHNCDVQVSGPGMRTAANLSDLKAGANETAVERGDIITLAGFGEAARIVDALVERSSRLAGRNVPAARPLKDSSRVRVHLGSTNVPAHLILAQTRSLEPGMKCLAQLRFERPVFAFAGDRFIIRDWSEQTTLAGGVILDALADGQRTEDRQQMLGARAEAITDASVFLATEINYAKALRTSGLLLRTRFSTAEVSEALKKVGANIIVLEPWAIDRNWWNELQKLAAEAVDHAHRAHPDQPGLPLSDLRALLSERLPASELFDALVAALCQTGFVQSGTALRRKAHELALPAHLQAAGERVKSALAAKPLDPPSRKEIAPDAASQQALRFLVQSGQALDLGQDVLMLTTAFQHAREKVQSLLRTSGKASASELRQALGTSRRVLIPLLEHLDREGVTRREADYRVLRG